MDKATLADITLDEFLDVKIDSLQKRIEHDSKELARLMNIRGETDTPNEPTVGVKRESNKISFFSMDGVRQEVSQKNIKKLIFDVLKQYPKQMASTDIYDFLCGKGVVEDVRGDRRNWIVAIGLCLGNFSRNGAVELISAEDVTPKVYKLINPDFM